MKIASWNVRGLNSVNKQRELRNYIREQDIVLIAIMENRMQENKIHRIMKRFDNKWTWCANSQYSTRERILVIWRSDRINIAVHD